jgi:exonuclease VII large subunit
MDTSIPSIKSLPPKSKSKNQKRKAADQLDARQDFKRIRYLEPEAIQRLDKLRTDLQASIERTVRIQQAFVKQLQKAALKSNRIKHIIQVVGEVPFHSELQRKIVSKVITTILETEDVEAKRLQEEEQKEALDEKRKEQLEYCCLVGCCEHC